MNNDFLVQQTKGVSMRAATAEEKKATMGNAQYTVPWQQEITDYNKGDMSD